jgi:kynureninase
MADLAKTGGRDAASPQSARDPLLRFRERFPILETCTYLISNSLGAMPAQAEDDLAEYARTWKTRGVRAWAETWWAMAGEVGDLIGSLFGAEPGTVSMHANVTLAEAVVVSAFDWSGPRNGVVYSSMNFPTVKYLYDRLARSQGARVTEVASPDGVTVPTEAMIAAIDERTLLVPMSHVLFQSAYVQDAEAICRRANEVGAHVVLDAYQSVGTVPVDVRRLKCSFLVGGTLKWLCGGPGAAFLWVRDDLRDRLEPRLTGWFAHPEPFAFEGPPMRYTKGAYRFMNGTTNVPGLYACRAGPAIVREAGVEAIREKSRRQTKRLLEAGLARGWRVVAPRDPERRGGTVAFDVPHGPAVKHALLDRGVIVDYRPGAGIRVSPHFYTDDAECDRAVEEIADVLEKGAWRAHEAVKTVVT